jgi:hypothetical protein
MRTWLVATVALLAAMSSADGQRLDYSCLKAQFNICQDTEEDCYATCRGAYRLGSSQLINCSNDCHDNSNSCKLSATTDCTID